MAATDYIETLYNTSIRGFTILDDYFASVIKPYTERLAEPVQTSEVRSSKITQSVFEPVVKSTDTSQGTSSLQDLQKVTNNPSESQPVTDKSSETPQPVIDNSSEKSQPVTDNSTQSQPTTDNSNEKSQPAANDQKENSSIQDEVEKIIASTLEAIKNIRIMAEFTQISNDQSPVENKSESSPMEQPEIKQDVSNNETTNHDEKKVDLDVTMEDVLDEKIDEIIAYVHSFELFILIDNQICSIRDFLSRIIDSRGDLETTVQSYIEKTINMLSYKDMDRLKQADVLALKEELENSFTK